MCKQPDTSSPWFLGSLLHCDLAGGVQALSKDGQCKTFDASADGFGRSEAVGAITLQRLADAEASGAPILGVVRGTAVNQDGRSASFMAPNGPSQEAVIKAALRDGGVEPHEVSYVETHGTGTGLGDPMEVWIAPLETMGY